MNIHFEKESTIGIDLPTLRETISLAESNGSLPNSRPIEHFDLIEMISEMTEKKGYVFQPDPIHVAKSQSKRIMKLDPNNEGLPGSYHFQRMVTRLQLLDLANEHHNTSIAIGYNEKGIQLAFGTNVKVCSNMSIFANKIMATYGAMKMPFDKMLQLAEKFINELPEIDAHNNAILNRMYNIEVTPFNVIQTIGDIHVRSVRSAYHGVPFAFGISQVSAFTQSLLRDHDQMLNAETGKPIRLYDFYNTGTYLMKPESSDISSLWPDIAGWSDYVVDKFEVLN